MGRFGGWMCGVLLACVAAPAAAQLSGTYTIGAGGDYASFASAVSAVTSQGVSGPVTFDVLNGTYTEQLLIGSISGSSAANTVTFQSQSGNPADVKLTFTPTSVNNYVVRLLQADNVTFRNMTLTASGSTSYGIVVKLDGDANNDRLLGNVIAGPQVAAGVVALALVAADADSVDNLVVSGNTFSYGGYALYLAGAGARSTGLQITDNVFQNTGFGPVSVRYQQGVLISGNVLNPAASAPRGIELTDCDGALVIVKNRIQIATNAYGMYLNGCDGGNGTTVARGLVANNFIGIGGTYTAYGFYLSGCTNLDLDHNSVSITSTVPAVAQALRIENTGGSGISVTNNILSNEGGGYAFYNAGAAAIVATSDYNDLYTSGNYLAYWGGADRTTLAALQGSSGKETHSVNVYPSFASAADLHTQAPWLNGRGMPVAGVSDDIDGDSRDGAAPDIGADEFTPDPATMTPLGGTYTIGAGGDYATPAAAQADLVLKGVSAPVTFAIAGGAYDSQLKLPQVPGASAANSITFTSQSGNAADVTLYHAAAAAADNYVVRLEGTDNVRFQNLTLSATGSAYGRVVSLFGGVDDLRLTASALAGPASSANSTNQALVFADNTLHTSLVLAGNVFTGGSFAVYLSGPAQTARAAGLQISGNTFTGTGYAPVWLRYQSGPQISLNVLSPAPGAARGIEADHCGGGLGIFRNRVTLAANAYGIDLLTCDGGSGSPAPRGLVANNFVSIGGTGTAYGLYLQACTNIDVYHNSVNVTSTSAALGQPLRLESGGSGLNILNNILANQGGGYSFVNANASAAVTNSGTNDLYTTGNFVGAWGGADRTTLAAFQAASGKETGSVSVYPHFAGPNDLHTPSPWLNGVGTALAAVTDDIDGNLRDASAPDIGASEFTPDAGAMTPLAGTYTIGPGGSYASFAAAQADLVLKGISAPVTFEVLDGTYDEQLWLPAVPGADAGRTVTFTSQSGHPTGVLLRHAASGAADNYVVRLDGADYVRFLGMSLATGNAAGAAYARVMEIDGGAEDIRIQNNVFTGTRVTGSSPNQALIYSPGSLCTSRLIDGNTLNDGTFGVAHDGLSASAPAGGLTVTGNTFVGTASAPVLCRYQNGLMLSGNTMTPAGSASRGAELDWCSGALQVVKNQITLATSAQGITLYSCAGGTGTPVARALVANNFVSIGGNTMAYGLYLNASSNVDLYSNSVNITSTNTLYGQALRIENAGGWGINVVDNILANAGGGYAYFNLGGSAVVAASGHNDLYTTGAVLGYWGGANRTDLASFQAASGMEAGSVSRAPGYTSAANLHRLDGSLDGLAVPLSAVAFDIDGDPRDASAPDIGADERLTVAALAELSVRDTAMAEGNAGPTGFVFTVLRTGPSDQTATVNYATFDVTATAPSDYAAGTGTVTFLPGETEKPVTVTVTGDALYEPSETFGVALSAPANASLADSVAVGTIINDDPLPSVSVNDVSIPEGNAGTSAAVFTLSLSAASDAAVSVGYATSNGTAAAGSDYAAASGTAVFPAGATAVAETVLVSGDVLDEPDETFLLSLAAPVGAALADSVGTCIIANDDVPVADLALVLADLADTVAAGGTVHYRIDVTNAGPDSATAVTVRDTLPAGALFQGAAGSGWSCAESAGVVTCTLGTLGVGAASPVYVDVTAPVAPGAIRSAAVAGSLTADPHPADNADAETTTVAYAGLDLSITKTAAPNPVTEGAPLSFTIIVSNAGPDAATGVVVRDTLPAGMTCPTVSGEGWNCTTTSGVAICTRASLAQGAAPPITVSCTAPFVVGTIANTATVTAAEPDPNTANNSATAVTTVSPVATSGQAIQDLISQVQCLVISGTLSVGNSNALVVKLEAALKAADQGKKLYQLQAFINGVRAMLLSGRLSASDAQALIAAASGIMGMFPASAFRSPDPYADIMTVGDGSPPAFVLGQNYPNPFNPTTTIRFSVAEPGDVTLAIYNVLGQEVARLVDGPMPAGSFEVTWTTTGVESGVYIYRLQSGRDVESKKLMLLR